MPLLQNLQTLFKSELFHLKLYVELEDNLYKCVWKVVVRNKIHEELQRISDLNFTSNVC